MISITYLLSNIKNINYKILYYKLKNFKPSDIILLIKPFRLVSVKLKRTIYTVNIIKATLYRTARKRLNSFRTYFDNKYKKLKYISSKYIEL